MISAPKDDQDRLRCPTCQKLFDPQQTVAMPFCSLRCKMVDLGRWLNEDYGMPIEPEDQSDTPPRVEKDDQDD